jgi:hypothetical protein
METTQGNSLCSYLYLKLAKTSCIFYAFFFYKIREQEDRIGRLVSMGRGRWCQGKGKEDEYPANNVYTCK